MEYISHLFEHFNTARITAITFPSDDRSFVDTQALRQFVLCQEENVKIYCILLIEYLQIPLHIVTAR